MSTNPVALEARAVEFSYRAPLIRGFSMQLHPNEVVGIVGPNGCGKTTVLKLFDGILKPSSGEVLIGGRQPLALLSRREVARRIAMVPQNGGLPGYQSVFHFALQGRSPHLSLVGFESARDEEIAREAMRLTHLERFTDARVAEISGGEKQRLLLARALTQEPEILLLDEFTANLDVNYQVELVSLIRTSDAHHSHASAALPLWSSLTKSTFFPLSATGSSSCRRGQFSTREVLPRS